MDDKIIVIEELFVGYRENANVLKHVNLTIYKNDFLGIIGPNGGGKTTLMKTILNLIQPTSGSIKYYRNNIEQKNLNIGYLPQVNMLDKEFPITVEEVILSGFTIKNKFFFKHSTEQKLRAKEVAEQMGLSHLLKRPIGKLSGGQMQRALLGRAIIDKPDVLILDEPNTYIDKQFESNLYELLKEINKNTAIIMVSHDVGTVISNVKNIACVNGGLHYHPGVAISTEWLAQSYSCPIELVGHGNLPHRVLKEHDDCDCCC